MEQRKYVISLSEFEKGILINSLMEYHNSVIRQDKSTIDIDRLLKRVLRAPLRKEPRCCQGEAR